jgi:hypothetical protein
MVKPREARILLWQILSFHQSGLLVEEIIEEWIFADAMTSTSKSIELEPNRSACKSMGNIVSISVSVWLSTRESLSKNGHEYECVSRKFFFDGEG